jgi:hypothetical protein
MQEILTKTAFSMQPGEAIWVRVARAQQLRLEECVGLDVWVTIDGRGGDIWLRTGECLDLLAGDRLLVSVQPKAAGPARLSLTAPARARDTALRGLARVRSRLLRRHTAGVVFSA